jgi:SAM-dependent methyltransferase
MRKTMGLLLNRLAAAGVTGGSLLEIGSGLGYLLDEARPYFRVRQGVELAPAAAAEASARAGAPVHTAIEALDSAARFDCIIATHVVEHVPDPVGFARDLAGRLARGGVLVLAAPDMASPLRRLMGNRWPSFKYPEHLAYFDGSTLPRVMEAAGLAAPERIPYPHAFPLGLILGKLGLPVPQCVHCVDVTLPTTTVCFMARRVVELRE